MELNRIYVGTARMRLKTAANPERASVNPAIPTEPEGFDLDSAYRDGITSTINIKRILYLNATNLIPWLCDNNTNIVALIRDQPVMIKAVCSGGNERKPPKPSQPYCLRCNLINSIKTILATVYAMNSQM